MNVVYRRAYFVLSALLVIVFGGVSHPPAYAQSNVLFILDASGSMKKKIDGKQRIDIARASLITSVLALQPDVRVGLMIYGARRAKDCKDIQLISPAAANDRDTVVLSMAGLEAKGETPIADSILLGAKEFRGLEGQRNSMVVLTDGIEECGGDPCAAASAVKAMGIDLKISIIGFELDPKERAAIACVPTITGGKYYDAKNGDELVSALTDTQRVAVAPPASPAPVPPSKPATPKPEKQNLRAVLYLSADKPFQEVASPSWTVSDASGGAPVVATRTLSNQLNVDVKSGRYKIEGSVGLASAQAIADVSDTGGNTVRINLNAGVIRARALAAPDKLIVPDAITRVRLDVANASGMTAGSYGEALTLAVPAGSWTLSAQLGNAKAESRIEVTAGAEIEVPLILNAGRLTVRAKSTTGTDLEGVRYLVVRTSDGSAVFGDTSFKEANYNLEAGAYHVRATLKDQQSEADVEIRPGETAERIFQFNTP